MKIVFLCLGVINVEVQLGYYPPYTELYHLHLEAEGRNGDSFVHKDVK